MYHLLYVFYAEKKIDKMDLITFFFLNKTIYIFLYQLKKNHFILFIL